MLILNVAKVVEFTSLPPILISPNWLYQSERIISVRALQSISIIHYYIAIILSSWGHHKGKDSIYLTKPKLRISPLHLSGHSHNYLLYWIHQMYIYIDTSEKRITYTIRKTWRKILLVTGHRREAIKSFNMDAKLHHVSWNISNILLIYQGTIKHHLTWTIIITHCVYLDLPMAINTIFVHHRMESTVVLRTIQFNLITSLITISLGSAS